MRPLRIQRRLANDLEAAVIVAMVAVREVQVTIDQIADVIAVRHRLVPAAKAVHVSDLMPATGVRRRAGRRVACAHFDAMLIDMIAVHVVQMTIVQVVHMVAMAHGGVPAIRTMNVAVIVMLGMAAFGHLLLHRLCCRRVGRRRR